MSMHTCIYGISPCVLSLALAPSQSAVPLLAVGMANKRVKVFQLTQDSGHPFQATAIFESSEHHTSMVLLGLPVPFRPFNVILLL